MPLVELSAAEAVANRKTNPLGGWPDRDGRDASGRSRAPNRVEPVCLPGFDVPRRFPPRARVLTIGSCFARNVEKELAARGFVLPMRRVLRAPEFGTLHTSVLNNYGTPSILNELLWAFEEAPYDPDAHLLELGPDRWIDLHLPPTLRPAPRDVVERRRAGIRAAYRELPLCDAVIVTLGYVEVWFDRRSECYLNTTPRPEAIRREPDRFVFRVLGYREIHDHLHRALELIARHGRRDREGKPDLQVIVSVSPVPLTATHRPDDVVVANAYSKAALRTAAEEVCAAFAFATYFPSFESVTLSDRRLAFQADQVHVAPDLVTLNVERMVEAFAGEAPPPLERVVEEVAAGGAVLAIGRLAALEARSPKDARRLVERFEREEGFEAFRPVAAAFWTRHGEPERALALLDERARTPDEPAAGRDAPHARTLAASGREREAFAVYRDLVASGRDPARRNCHAMLELAARLDDEALVADARAVIAERLARHPNRDAFLARDALRVAAWRLDRGERAAAQKEIARARALDPDVTTRRVYLYRRKGAGGIVGAAARAWSRR